MMPESDRDLYSGDAHLDATKVAAYVDGQLDAADRARVEEHVADCDACRAEVVAVRRLLGGARRRIRWPVVAGIVAAAAVLLVVWPRGIDRRGAGEPVVRENEPAGPTVVLIAPDSVANRPLAITWHEVPTAATYQLSLTSSSGELIWSVATSDTAVTVADSVSLTTGQPYFYYVDALLTDGTSVTSGVREVRLRP